MTDLVDRLVVGLDDTAASKAALRFALQEAARRNCAVDVVTAWTWRAPAELPVAEDVREWARARAQQIQDDVVASVLSDVEGSATMTRQVVEGDAGRVLLRAASSAAYLVVGTGRKGPFRRALLGSVSNHCVHHSSCPVLVVPAPKGTADSDDRGLLELQIPPTEPVKPATTAPATARLSPVMDAAAAAGKETR